MKRLSIFLAALSLLILTACDARQRSQRSEVSTAPATSLQALADRPARAEPEANPQPAAQRARAVENPTQASAKKIDYVATPVSLEKANASEVAAGAMDRRIIRNAEFTIVVETPTEAQRHLAAIAERHGGFVVKSEINQADSHNPTAPKVAVTITLRVPAAHFGATIDELRGKGQRIIQERITGQDVTEEYIDLEARLRTKRALELQFLEILKRASKVSDALEVQHEVANVRTEIEQLEGRRRWLENQASLSTITITLQTPTPIITVSQVGFVGQVQQTLGESIDLAVAIIVGLLRFVIMLIPVALLILLPGAWLARFALRRWRPDLTGLKLKSDLGPAE